MLQSKGLNGKKRKPRSPFQRKVSPEGGQEEATIWKEKKTRSSLKKKLKQGRERIF